MALPLRLALVLPLLAAAPRQDAYLGVIFDASDRPTVAEVVPGSPAERAGLQPGDVLLAIDGTTMPNVPAFAEAIRKYSAGDRIKLAVRRNGQLTEIPVTLGKRFDEAEKPKPAMGDAPAKTKPAETKPPEAKAPETKGPDKQAPQDREEKRSTPPAAPGGGRPFLGVSVEETGTKLVVRAVLGGSPAERAGAAVLDEVEALGATTVRSLDQLDAALRALPPRAKTTLVVMRSGTRTELPLTIGWVDDKDGDGHKEPAKEVPKQPAPASGHKLPPAGSQHIDHPRLAEVLAEAKKRHCHALVICGAAWSASSQAQRRSLGNESLAPVLANFAQTWVDVDVDGQLADLLQTRELPTLVVLDVGGHVLAKKDGYLAPDLLANWLGTLAKAPAPAPQGPNSGLDAHDADLVALRAEVANLRAEVERLRAELGKLKK